MRLLRPFEGRTIPTHVGRTGAWTWRARAKADHPHARGENALPSTLRRHRNGPSPRTWGERARSVRNKVAGRTIPTHVGRTPAPHIQQNLSSDHPHARGENNMRCAPRFHSIGPSPRTWGEPRPFVQNGSHVRTIPTHVGRTSCEGISWRFCTDHPHARGENSGSALIKSTVTGPSPRTWGEPTVKAL